MSEMGDANPVVGLWEAFDRLDFVGAGAFLADDFVAEWPQSGERIRGRENFVALNQNYPGLWQVEIGRVVAVDDLVISEVSLSCEGKTVFAVSFFTVTDGKIVRAVEYWADPYDPPAWRSRWVERMQSDVRGGNRERA